MTRIQEARARVHAQAGNPDLAVEILAQLLQEPGELSIHLLRLDPRYDFLRGHEGFQSLLDEDGPGKVDPFAADN